jgi:hypothetical protein
MAIKVSDVRIFDQETGEEFKGTMWGQHTPTTKKVYKTATEPFFTISDKPWSGLGTGETLVFELPREE